MKNKYVSTRIMAMVMAAAMTVSAAPAVYAAERADSETIKEDNQPAAEDSTESADTEDSSAEATKTEYPLTITTYDYDGNEIETTYTEPGSGACIVGKLSFYGRKMYCVLRYKRRDGFLPGKSETSGWNRKPAETHKRYRCCNFYV